MRLSCPSCGASVPLHPGWPVACAGCDFGAAALHRDRPRAPPVAGPVARFAAPVDQVRRALLGGVAGCVVEHEDDNRVQWRTGTSLRSHAGQTLVAHLWPGDGTVVSFTSARNRTGLASFQAYDWGEGAHLARTALRRMQEELGEAEILAAPQPSSWWQPLDAKARWRHRLAIAGMLLTAAALGGSMVLRHL